MKLLQFRLIHVFAFLTLGATALGWWRTGDASVRGAGFSLDKTIGAPAIGRIETLSDWSRLGGTLAGGPQPDFRRWDLVPVPHNGLWGTESADLRIGAFDQVVSLDVQHQQLRDLILDLEVAHGLDIRLAAQADDCLVDFRTAAVPLRDALRGILDELGLDYVVWLDEVYVVAPGKRRSIRADSLVSNAWTWWPDVNYRVRLGGIVVIVLPYSEDADDVNADSRAELLRVPKHAWVRFMTKQQANLVDIGVGLLLILLAAAATRLGGNLAATSGHQGGQNAAIPSQKQTPILSR
jgi:hypothetical protein